jgi:excisionase family DNA binding protein
MSDIATTTTVSNWATVDQEAQRVQLGKKILYEAIKAGRLRAARVANRRAYRLRPAWTDAWLESSAEPVEIKR